MISIARVVAAFLTGLLFLSVADAQVAPGVNCQRDPQLGEVCGLYRDIYGLADAATNGRRSFSSGGWVVANEFAYSGRADSGSGLTYATGSGTGYATFGLLRAEASGVAGTGGEWLGPNAVGNGRTRVGFSDRINVQSTALNGLQGTVVAWLELSGERQVSSSAWGSSDAGVQVVTPSQTVLGQVFSNGGVTSASGNVPSVIELRIPLTFSASFFQPFSVYMYAFASASASNGFNQPQAAQGISDYGSTLAWGGMSVLDAQGNLVDDWSVRSSSGFDYSRSFASQVPEPSQALLLLVGGLLLLAIKRRIDAERIGRSNALFP
jgi:hypothetical protein